MTDPSDVAPPSGRVEGGPAVVAELTGDTVKRPFDLEQPFQVEGWDL
ncbi:MAG: hypothetical protein GY713_09980 [Actinomycetia bacterium]|nr:hypothetical protein [Actinomycetes bacterium]